MVEIVKLALRRPYTFVVMALLILIFGIMSIFRTPTDIFPEIDIPVISVVFSYNGLSPDAMAGRIVTYYERAVTTSVNDIEHIESQSMTNYGIIKIFFQPTVNINAALAEVAGLSQTVLKQLPAGITPPTILSFDAASVPILQLALSSDQLSQSALIRPGQQLHPSAARLRPRGGHTLALWRRGSADPGGPQSAGAARLRPVGERRGQRPGGAKPDHAGRQPEDRQARLHGEPEQLPVHDRRLQQFPIRTIDGAVVYMRDVAFVHKGSPPQTNVVQVEGKDAVLLSVIKGGPTSTLDIIAGIKSRLPAVAQTLPASLKLTVVGDQSPYVKSAIVDVVREALIAAVLTRP